ncbi:sensor histidine kinase [Streptomyces sp. 8N616]|uniref:sensor histidine kinase n=1 Tax=Streptomyces sp. 8N616 TaxID=3457414 RepID=UPI003FD50B82
MASERARAHAVWSRLVVPGAWPRRRIVGEVVLSLALALLAAGLESLTSGSGLRILATAVAVGLLSPLRRVLPATVLVVTGAAAGGLGGFAPLLIVAGWSAGRGIASRGRAVGSFSAAMVLHAALSAYTEAPALAPVATLIFSTVFFLATTVVPGLASRYWRQRRRLLDALREHNAQLLRERAMIAGQARMRERQRIAQDMHDSLGHQLALIAVHTGALEVDPELTERQREAVGVLRDASVAAMHELREVVGILRDGTPEPQPVEGAQPASRGAVGIEALVEASRAVGAAVELRRSGEPRPLAPAADHAAYRIAQEGLTNAHKYAAGAWITVGLRYEPDSLVVEVANGPVPVPAAGAGQAGNGAAVRGGQGLVGLRERARLIGGMVHAGPTGDGGFRVAGVLPYGPDGGGGGRGGGCAGPGGAASGGQGGAAGRDAGGPASGVAGVADPTLFVDGADDFWTQGEGVALGDSYTGDSYTGDPYAGGPYTGDPYAGGSYAEGAGLVAKSSRGRSLALGCAILSGIALVMVALVVWGFALVVGEAGESMIDPSVYESVRIGDPEVEVRDKLPKGSFMTGGLHEKGPAKPEGAACLTLMSTETPKNWDTQPAFRFCFRDGKLIEKRSFAVRE